MNNLLETDLYVSGKEIQYDEHVKRLLSNKRILSYILIHTLEEYENMVVQDVIFLLDQRYESSVPVDPGMTNKTVISEDKKITGLNTEDTVVNESLIRYDVFFCASKADESDHMIVDVEAQKDCPPKRSAYNRSLYYISRMISAQKEREFLHSQYSDMKSVASIWILMNMDRNTFSEYYMGLGRHDGYIADIGYHKDMENIVFIGLGKEIPAHKEGNGLYRLLGVLLSTKMSYQEKINIIENEYPDVIDQDVREEMNSMCNLGEGLAEEREAIGYDKAVIHFVLQMNKQHLSLEQIMSITGKSEQEIKEIISKSDENE